MSVAFPGLMPSLGFFPKAAWGGTAPSPPLAIRHRKKSRGQDGAVALPKGRRGFVGVGAQIAGLVCEWGFKQSHLPARVDVPLFLSAVVQVLHRQLVSLLFEGRNGCKSRSKKKKN